MRRLKNFSADKDILQKMLIEELFAELNTFNLLNSSNSKNTVHEEFNEFIIKDLNRLLPKE